MKDNALHPDGTSPGANKIQVPGVETYEVAR